MNFKDYSKFRKLLLSYAPNLEARHEYLVNSTDEEKDDLLEMILYLESINADFKSIRFNVNHDITGINKKDPFFMPRSYGYKSINETNLN